MPLTNTIITNKLERLTEISANASATLAELEKTKKELAVSRAEARLALSKSPLVPGRAYPLSLAGVVIGTPATRVLERLDSAKWDVTNQYIEVRLKDDPVFSGAAYFFDASKRVSGILYHFNHRGDGATLVRMLLLSHFGEPIANDKGDQLWKISGREWASITQLVPEKGYSLQVDAEPSASRWGKLSK